MRRTRPRRSDHDRAWSRNEGAGCRLKIMIKQKDSLPDAPHLPRSAPIDAYGKGGFAFAEMSHRGSLLCLPDAIWAWPVTRPEQIDRYSLQRVFASANSIDTLIVGTGSDIWLPPSDLREALRAV